LKSHFESGITEGRRRKEKEKEIKVKGRKEMGGNTPPPNKFPVTVLFKLSTLMFAWYHCV